MTDGFTGEKSTFHETKEIVSRLKEPLKIKTVAITSTIPEKQGHMIEITVNTNIFDAESLEQDLTDMINLTIRLIEGPMGSKYLGNIKK